MLGIVCLIPYAIIVMLNYRASELNNATDSGIKRYQLSKIMCNVRAIFWLVAIAERNRGHDIPKQAYFLIV